MSRRRRRWGCAGDGSADARAVRGRHRACARRARAARRPAPQLPLVRRPGRPARARAARPLRGRAITSATPTASLRENVDAYLAENGIDLRRRADHDADQRPQPRLRLQPADAVLVPRPRPASLRCVVAEVHNTYGQRHRYLLRTDDAGRVETAKEFYVSPFYPVDGHYRMSLPEPGDRLAITITLHRPDERPFTASVRGVRRPATRRAVLATAAAPSARDLARPRADHRPRHPSVAQGPAGPAPPAPPVRPAVPNPARSPCPAQPTVADRLAALVRDAAGIDLPVRVRAWDGSEAGPPDGAGAGHPLAAGAAPAALGAGRAGPGPRLRDRRPRRRGRPGRRLPAGLAAGALAPADRRRARPLRGQGAGPRWRLLGSARSAPAPKPPASEARLSGGLHTRLRDRAAIAHHYDLSNEFYELLLDESMAYSSAYFTHEGQSLADAQRAKLDLICRKLGLRAGHAAARRGLRLGVAGPARGRALRRARHRHHAVGPAARLHRQARGRPRPGRPGRGPAAGLPRAGRGRRDLRRGQLDRDG